MSGREGPAPRPPWIVWAGLAVVLGAAAVLSFDALRSLALAVAIPAQLAWLMPVAVDAGAAVSAAAWLGRRTSPDAARYAGRMTWALLTITVAGNAAGLGMHAGQIPAPWWAAVMVGTIPPAVVGATVHLVVLMVRAPAAPATAAGEVQVLHTPAGDDTDGRPQLDEHGTSLAWATAPAVAHPSPAEPPAGDGDRADRAADLIGAGAGRRTLSRDLGITEHQARALLTQHRNGSAP